VRKGTELRTLPESNSALKGKKIEKVKGKIATETK
jgi:hypothetical protein